MTSRRFALPLIALLAPLFACPTQDSAKPALPGSKHDEFVAATVACASDDECKLALDKDFETFKAADNLGSCDVWKAIGCGTLVAATAVACVDPADGACEEAIAEDKAAGCCDCIPKGKVRDLCKAIPAEAGTGTGAGADTGTGTSEGQVQPPTSTATGAVETVVVPTDGC